MKLVLKTISLGFANCFESTLSSFGLKLKVSCRSTSDLDSGKVGTTNHAQLKFHEATHLLCRGWVCGVKRQKFAQHICV